ncbi:MAG: hypothetical protein ACKOFI_09340, partial [Phycisphaerales bacterium]
MIRQAAILAGKDLRLLLRDRAAAFFTFAFPLAVALFFGYVFSGTTSEPLKVVAFVERPSPQASALVGAMVFASEVASNTALTATAVPIVGALAPTIGLPVRTAVLAATFGA